MTFNPVFSLEVDANKTCRITVVDDEGTHVAEGNIADFKLMGADGKEPMSAPVDILMTGRWSVKEIITRNLPVKSKE